MISINMLNVLIKDLTRVFLFQTYSTDRSVYNILTFESFLY